MTSPEDSADRHHRADGISSREKWLAGVLLSAAMALRVFYIFRYRYDSDEPQHLHTTWGWTQGLLQYRDFFDNHTPLFHLLFSPLVALLGERTNILSYMRFAMVPLWCVSLACVWQIGRVVYSRRVGLWGAVFISLLPWWFFCSVEYRTDNLWTPLWLGAVAVLVSGRLTKWRGFASGLLLGLCFTVSMKTSLLLAVCVLAAVATAFLCAGRFSLGHLFRFLTAGWPVLGGALIAPGVLCAFFAAQGAWEPFYYGIIGHNILAGVDAKNHPLHLRLVFPVALPFLLWIAFTIVRRTPAGRSASRRCFLFLVAGFYETALYSFWTLLTRQDDLPFYPLAALLATALVISSLERRFVDSAAARWAETRSSWILGTLGLVEIVVLLGGRPPWIDGTQRERETLAEVLRLTRPGEFVMDFKGESVFRRRAFYYVLEPLTYVRLKEGLIEDTVAERLVATKTCVALNQDRWYPKRGARFIEENYLAVGRMRVAGRVIAKTAAPAAQPIKFEINVPAAYVAWADGKIIGGQLDGSTWTQARQIAAGPHEFTPDAGHASIAVLWARAAELGVQPLADQPGWQYYR